MLVAQTVYSWNNDGLPVDVAFDTNRVFYLLLRINSTMVSDGAQCKTAAICLLYCYHKWPYCKNICWLCGMFDCVAPQLNVCSLFLDVVCHRCGFLKCESRCLHIRLVCSMKQILALEQVSEHASLSVLCLCVLMEWEWSLTGDVWLFCFSYKSM